MGATRNLLYHLSAIRVPSELSREQREELRTEDTNDNAQAIGSALLSHILEEDLWSAAGAGAAERARCQ